MKFSLHTLTLSFCLFFCTNSLSALSEYALAQRALKEGKFFRPGKDDGTHNNFFKPLSVPAKDRNVSLWILPEGMLQLRYVMQNGRSGQINIHTASNRFTLPADKKSKRGKKNMNIGQYMISFTGLPLQTLFIKPNPQVLDPAVLANMDFKKYPDANKELLHLKMVQDKEKVSFYINGNYAGSFHEGPMASLTAVLHSRSASILDLSSEEKCDPGFVKVDLSSRAKHDIAAKISLTEKLPVPMLEKISHAVDMRKINSLPGKIRYRDIIHSKTAFDGLDTYLHMSVPSARYNHAYILCAPISVNEKNMFPAFHLLMTRYAKYGRADSAIVKANADLTKGGKNIRKVGTATLKINGKEVQTPLYLVSLALPHWQIEDIISKDTWSQLPFRDFLDIDLQGPTSANPKVKVKSSLAVFGITLEKNPVDIFLKQKTAGNLFIANSSTPEIIASVTGKKAGKYALYYTVKDVDNKKVLSGKKEFTLAKEEKKDLSIKLDPPGRGYFSVLLDLQENGKNITQIQTSFVKLAPAARKWKAGTSPYSSWYWGQAHNLTAEMDKFGSILNKLGIYMVSCATSHSEKEWQKYGITFAQFPNMLEKIFTEKNILSNDPVLWEKMEKELIRQVGELVRRYPSTKKILLQHESYKGSYKALPQTLLNKEPRKFADEKKEKLEKARVKAATVYCKIIRKHFPHLKIVFGNSCWAQEMIESFAARGFDPALVDYIGSEAVGSWVASPECFSLWNPDGSAYVLRETARVNGFKNQPVTATYEWSCRSSNLTDDVKDPEQSAIRQAQWLIRDVMTALSYSFDSIPLMSVTDTGTAYNNGRTYGALGCMDRQFNPKPLAAAVGTVTRIMDQVKFTGNVKSPTDILLFSFKRSDGKNIYTLWVPKGSAKCRIKVKGSEKDILSEDLYGREKFYKVKNGSFESSADGTLRYFITENTFESLSVLERTFPTMKEPEKLTKVIPLSAKDFVRVTEKDDRIDGREFNDRSFQAVNLVKSTIKDVNDREKGKCVEVAFDISNLPADHWYHGGYTMYRFKKPIPIPENADGIGLWVKGNGSLGRLAWEVKDHRGNFFISNGEPRNGANLLNVMYDNEFYSPSWRFMYMALTPVMAQPQNWFSLQWHGKKGAIGKAKEVTGILLSTSNKMPRIFELQKVKEQKITLKKMSFFTAPGATEKERNSFLSSLSPEAEKVFGGQAGKKVNKNVSPLPSTGNLIKNPSFETLALPAAKQLPGSWKLEGSEFPLSWEMHPVPNRKNPALIGVRKDKEQKNFLWMQGTYVCLKAPVQDLPGGKYLFKAKVKGSGLLAARFFYHGGTGKAIRFRPSKSDWKEVSGILELPAGKSKIYLVLQQGASKGDLSLDDISLTPQ